MSELIKPEGKAEAKNTLKRKPTQAEIEMAHNIAREMMEELKKDIKDSKEANKKEIGIQEYIQGKGYKELPPHQNNKDVTIYMCNRPKNSVLQVVVRDFAVLVKDPEGVNNIIYSNSPHNLSLNIQYVTKNGIHVSKRVWLDGENTVTGDLRIFTK